MLTLIGVVLWLAPHALGALGAVLLATPTFDTCEKRCTPEVFERRSQCEAQFPAPEQEDAYKSCRNAAEEFGLDCVNSCNACGLACNRKAVACSEGCPCGEGSPCFDLCQASYAKCSEYCGLARPPIPFAVLPCPPEAAPEPAGDVAPATTPGRAPEPAREPTPEPAPEPAPSPDIEVITPEPSGGVD